MTQTHGNQPSSPVTPSREPLDYRRLRCRCGSLFRYEQPIHCYVCTHCGNRYDPRFDVGIQGEGTFIGWPAEVTSDEEILRNFTSYFLYGDSVPDGLAAYAEVKAIQKRLLPCALVKLKYRVSWVASFGYTKEVKVKQLKNNIWFTVDTHTETDWKVDSGDEDGTLFLMLSLAGTSSTRLADLFRRRIFSFHPDGLYPVSLLDEFYYGWIQGYRDKPSEVGPLEALDAYGQKQIEDEIVFKIKEMKGRGDKQKWGKFNFWKRDAQIVHEGFYPVVYGLFEFPPRQRTGSGSESVNYHAILDNPAAPLPPNCFVCAQAVGYAGGCFGPLPTDYNKVALFAKARRQKYWGYLLLLWSVGITYLFYHVKPFASNNDRYLYLGSVLGVALCLALARRWRVNGAVERYREQSRTFRDRLLQLRRVERGENVPQPEPPVAPPYPDIQLHLWRYLLELCAIVSVAGVLRNWI